MAEVEVLAYSPVEAAQAIGVSEATIQRLIRDGDLPSFTIRRSRRITIAALRDFLVERSGTSKAS